jgi:uncharacterized membrane protein
MKKILLTGLISLIPIILTVVIIGWIFDQLTDPFLPLAQLVMEKLGIASNATLLIFLSRILVLISLFLFVFILGWAARKFFTQVLMSFANKLFLKIPLVGSIYRITGEVTKAVFSQEGKTFKKTVLIPFPGAKDAHALGLVTGEVPPSIKKALSKLDIAVFVPTAPQPTSGYMLMTPRHLVTELEEVTTEDTFKFLLSCGTSPLVKKS